MNPFPEYACTAGFPLAHIEIFKQVSLKNRIVISSRELNPLCTDLLLENYAAKGRSIKAKTCDWGPMAGFVPADHRFTKANQSPSNQQAALIESYRNGVETIPLLISVSRATKLEQRGVFTVKSRNAKTMHVIAKPNISTQAQEFILINQPRCQYWAICYPEFITPETKNFQTDTDTAGYLPIKGLVNPGSNKNDFKSAVCGDYDLWCLFPHVSLDAPGINDRLMSLRATLVNPAARKTNSLVARRAYEAGLIFASVEERETLAQNVERKEIGNISLAVNRIRHELNRLCRPGGGDVVMHADYGGYPAGKIDFPLIFFIPILHDATHSVSCEVVKTIPELRQILRWMRSLHYRVELNPAWSVPLFKI